MKKYEDIISRFDNIQELSVSEEMLGAYLEGNLDLYEMENISKMLQDDELLQTISEDIMFSSPELNHNDLLDIEMGDDATTSGIENNTTVDADYSMIDSDENIMEHESYIEDCETIENNDSIEDSLFDDSTFELPEIPFFDTAR